MIAPDAFDDLEAQVARLNNLDAETAGLVVVAVGDTRALDPSGKTLAILPDGRELLVDWPEDED